MGLGGFEPPTSRLSGGRSNQLSYRPRLDTSLQCAMHRRVKRRVTSRAFELASLFSPPRSSPLPKQMELILVSNISVRKEVIQPQVPLRLPCYDLVPITELAFDVVPPKVGQNGFEHSPLSWLDGRCVQGSGTYSPRRS